MTADALMRLWYCTIALSGAILLVAALRLPLRRAFGTRAACWLWLLVPLSLAATLVPRPARTIQALTTIQEWSGTGLPNLVPQVRDQLTDSTAIVLFWLIGAAVMLGVTAVRQRRFVRSLGMLTRLRDGTLRSHSLTSPLVVGALRPLLIVPADFEQRFTASQRELMLAHERTHLARGDTRVAALATGLVCAFWFNPLVYWALRLLRLDLEMACDATVLARPGMQRHLYASALLETQLSTQLGIALPAGCHWRSAHPLKTRISVLKNPLPGRARTMAGIAIAGLLGAGTAAALWVTQPATAATANGAVVMSMKWFAEETQTRHIVRVSTENQLVPLGQELISSYKETPYSAACTPAPAASSSAQWLLQCSFRKDGKVLASPSITASEGDLPSMDWSDRDTGVRFYLVVNVSDSPDRIRLAQQQAATKH